MVKATLLKPDRNFIKRVEQAGGGNLKHCYQCAACAAVCKLSPENNPFPRKEMIYAQWGLKDKLVADPDIWLCHQCNDCSVRCPRGAKPGDVMAALRSFAFEHFAFPSFMGRLLATPSGLWILFLIPMLILGSLAHWNEITAFQGDVHFYNFISNGKLEMLFMGGNALIFLLAAVGLARFYRGMSESWGIKPQMGFISAAVRTLWNIIRHDRFSRCDAGNYRRLAHLLVFYGFLGAMATAGLALMRMLYLHYIDLQHIPLDTIPAMALYHPFKILGNLSGLALVNGIIIMLSRRRSDPESAGITLYPQRIFLYSLLVIAATGLLIQFLRIYDLPMLAYGFYFGHLVFVFFLLWYAPYSQFGHMFYRALAMTFAEGIRRKPLPLNRI